MIFLPRSNGDLNGIFTYLYYHYPDPIQYRKEINATGSSQYQPGKRGDPYSAINPEITCNENTCNWHTENIQNSFIEFSFFSHKVNILNYTLKSRNDADYLFPLEWKLEGKTQLSEWEQIHYHERNNDIAVESTSKTFTVDRQSFYNSFRLTQLGQNYYGIAPVLVYQYYFVLNKIEFFGILLENIFTYKSPILILKHIFIAHLIILK